MHLIGIQGNLYLLGYLLDDARTQDVNVEQLRRLVCSGVLRVCSEDTSIQ